jgi:hypothetical protein
MPESMCWRELAEQATKETDPQKPTKIMQDTSEAPPQTDQHVPWREQNTNKT